MQVNKSFQSAGIEALSIVLAVLLALGVDEWREERSQQQQAKAALIHVQVELNSNRELLELIHANNTETIRVMNQSQDSGEEVERNFIPGHQLRETAWETLLSTGISNYVDYQTILELSATYSMQRIYKDTGSKMSAAAMNVAAYATVLGTEVDDNNYQQQFLSYFELLVAIETTLLESYQSSLAYLNITED